MNIYVAIFAEIYIVATNKRFFCANETDLMTNINSLHNQGLYPGDDFDVIAANPADAPKLTSKLRAVYAMA